MEKQPTLYRYEIKYFVNKRQAAELALFLKRNMYVDPNADETGCYWIRSLYFDTIDNKDYHEKIIGYNIRKKIRLRIYKLPTEDVKVEIKNKYNHSILKETATISLEDANKLIQGNSHFLLNYNHTVTNKIFTFMHQSLYRPTVTIDYQREAYLYPFQNIRITLDKNLYATFSPDKFFKKDICMIPVLNDNVSILEVKYNHIIPVFLQTALSNFIIQKSQISKYCLGRSILGK